MSVDVAGTRKEGMHPLIADGSGPEFGEAGNASPENVVQGAKRIIIHIVSAIQAKSLVIRNQAGVTAIYNKAFRVFDKGTADDKLPL